MKQDLQAEGDVVYFPVPKRYLQVVIDALAKAMAGSETPPAPPETPWPAEEADGPRFEIDWSDVRNMRRLLNELRGEGVNKALELAATRPGEIISTQEIVKASGQERRAIAGQLGAMTKLIKRQFNLNHKNFNGPFKFEWAAGGEQQAYYRMQPEVAQAWHEATGR